MKRMFNKAIAIFLVVIMTLGAVPLGGIINTDWSSLFSAKANAVTASSMKVGSKFEFGSYFSSVISGDEKVYVNEVASAKGVGNNSTFEYNGRTVYKIDSTSYNYYDPIVWRVLRIDDDGVLCITDKIITARIHNGYVYYSDTVLWENCELRKWLNSSFYNVAFTEKEKDMIHLTNVVNAPNSHNGLSNGNNTEDKIFCLSEAEALSCFSSDEDRIASKTQYVSDVGFGSTSWFLRTLGYTSLNVGIIKENGSIFFNNDSYLSHGSDKGQGDALNGIRPALKLNLDAVISDSPATAKSYKVKVVNQTTNLPVQSANVQFAGKSYITDSKGMVELERDLGTPYTSVVTVTNPGYEKAEIQIDELNPYSLNTIKIEGKAPFTIADAYLAGEEISGPVLNFLGYEFPIFKFNGGIELPLSEITKLNISSEADAKEHKVKYLLGVKDSWKSDSDMWSDDKGKAAKARKECYENFKNFYQSLKDAPDSITREKYNNIKKMLNKGDGKLGFNCGLQVGGYITFDYSTGMMKLAESGIFMIVEAGLSVDVPWSFAYVTFKLGGEFNGTLKTIINDSGTMQFSGTVAFSVKPGIAAGIKVISKKFLNVEAGIDGKITGTATLPAESFAKVFTASMSASVYIKAKEVGLFEQKCSNEIANMELYPDFGKVTKSLLTQTKALYAAPLMAVSSSGITDEDGEHEFELIDRSYLSSQPKKRLLMGSNTVSLNKTSVYPYGEPEMIRLTNGDILAAYIYDDGTKSDINRTTLYWSLFSDGAWSAPVPVDNSGKADFGVRLACDGEKVYAIWRRASEVLADGYTTDDILDKTELVFAVFENGAWSTPAVLDSAEKFQADYTLAYENGTLLAAWSESTGENTDVIFYMTYTDGTWSEKTVLSNISGLFAFTGGFQNGNPAILYTKDADISDDALNDVEVYLNNAKITDNDCAETSLTFADGSFYWLEDAELVSFDGSINHTGVYAENNYSVITNGSTKAVVTTVTTDFTNELTVCYEKGGAFTSPVPITSFGKHISDFSVVCNADGTVTYLADVENLNPEEGYPFTTTDMICDTVGDSVDLSLDSAWYDGLAVRGGSIRINGTVKNNSPVKVSSYDVVLLAENGDELIVKKNDYSIGTGESKDFSFTYSIPENFTKQDLTVLVRTDGDSNAENDATVITVGEADIAITEMTIAEDGTLSVTVINNGCETALNVTADIYSMDDPDTVYALTFGDLEIGESKTASLVLTDEQMAIHGNAFAKKYVAEVATTCDEYNKADNTAEYEILAIQTESVTFDSDRIEMANGEKKTLSTSVLPVDATNQTVYFASDNTNVATVTDDGVVTAIGEGEAVITAMTEDTGVTAQCTVSVIVPVTGITVNPDQLSLNAGETAVIDACTIPADATNKAITYTSTDASVATVDENGMVTAISTGTTTIKATTADGGFESICEVRVVTPMQSLSLSAKKTTLYPGDSTKATVTMVPAQPDDDTLLWQVDNDDIISLDTDGNITALRLGTAVVTVESKTYGKKAQLLFTVVCNHVTVTDEGYAATCVKDGLSTGKHCSVCNEILLEQTVIKAAGHTLTRVKTEYPTCIKKGTEYYKCVDCDYEEQKEISAYGHEFVADAARSKAATCTGQGLNAFTCAYCEATNDEIIEPLGHTVTVDEAIEPKCPKSGWTEGSHCSVCGEIIIPQIEIPASDHEYEDVVVKPSCLKDGYTVHTCKVCGYSYTDTPVSTNGHIYSVEIVNAGCVENGTITMKCSECGSSVSTVIPATGHRYISFKVEPTCEGVGYTRHVCAYCTDEYTDSEVSAKGHSFRTQIIKPTCTENGCNIKICETCGYNYEYDMVNALGHSMKTVSVTIPACTSNGVEVLACERCDSVDQRDLPATGHTPSDWITDKDSTCTETGTKHKECTVCHETVETGTIDKKAHTVVTDAAVAATCTKTGLTEGAHCSVCKTVLTKQNTVPMLTHTDTNHDAKCDTCGKDLGSPAQPSNPAANCSHMCHKTGFLGFLWKIVNLFNKLFKTKQYCSCGARHW